jgi:hypothetical protein
MCYISLNKISKGLTYGALLEIKLNRPSYSGIGQRILSLTAVLFGAVTIFAGTRVLTGSHPGYVVFLPLLIYNTVMGFIYVGVGAIAWRSLKLGRNGAAAIFLLNLLVLAAIRVLHTSGGAVAADSLHAMTFRTIVWFVLFIGLGWLSRRAIGNTGQIQ